MEAPARELEGIWEDILSHSPELAGRKVRVTVLSDHPGDAEPGNSRRGTQPALELLAEWEKTPLTDEEREILDGFEQFNREHPFSLRPVQDDA